MTVISKISCPVCGDDAQFRELFIKKDRHFWRCLGCTLEKQYPLPSALELEAYYDASFREGMYKTFTSASLMKDMTARQRYKEVGDDLPNGRWLDVGAANGIFVREAKEQGQEAEGIELSEVAVAEAKEAGLSVSCSTLEDHSSGEGYDAITAFDVIEHVLDPKEFLEAAYERLRPGGRIALTMPNKASLVCHVMGRRWYFYIPEEHLHYYDPKVIRQLFEATGFQSVRTSRTYKPLSFDYSLSQFVEYNPLIYRVLSMIGKVLPRALKTRVFPIYIGEMLAIAEKPK